MSSKTRISKNRARQAGTHCLFLELSEDGRSAGGGERRFTHRVSFAVVPNASSHARSRGHPRDARDWIEDKKEAKPSRARKKPSRSRSWPESLGNEHGRCPSRHILVAGSRGLFRVVPRFSDRKTRRDQRRRADRGFERTMLFARARMAPLDPIATAHPATAGNHGTATTTAFASPL